MGLEAKKKSKEEIAAKRAEKRQLKKKNAPLRKAMLKALFA